MYCQFINNMYTIYPIKSLTQNKGLDGSGVHGGNTDRFEVQLWQKTDKFRFKYIKPKRKIVEANRIFRTRKFNTNVI